MESKLSGHLSSRNTSTNANLPISARKIMTDLQSSSIKPSLLSTSNSHTQLGAHQVPHNSPCSLTNQKVDSRKYMRNNGETKRSRLKVCSNQVNLNISSTKETDQQEIFNSLSFDGNKQLNGKSNEHPLSEQVIPHCQQFVRSSEPREMSSQTRAKATPSCDLVWKQDSGTNTDPEDNLKPHMPFKFTPNSSIISMKTSKPEKEQSFVVPRKQLNIQKMPSLNIRSELTIQAGPKVNIVATGSNVYQPKRKNTEFFDVLYQSNSFNSLSASSGINNVGQFKMKESTFVCERHAFPSGQLIPQSHSDELRRNETSLEEKKVFLVGLIKAVSEKIEKQWNTRKTCCRLLCSLPLLASVVDKVQVDCVRCLATLDRHLATLTALMREELRSQKQMTDKQCCQLDDTVQYQIVELELMQGDKAQGHTPAAPVQVLPCKGQYS